MSPTRRLINYEEALTVVRRLAEAAAAAGEPLGSPIVMLGGTALAALGIRKESLDVDLFVRSCSQEVVLQVEAEMRQRYGEAFRLDVTGVANVWGYILLQDIETRSPKITTLSVDGVTIEVRALSPEDLFLLKLDAGRAKDRADLAPLLAATSAESLIDRFNQIVQWHGNQSAVLGYADSFVRALDQIVGMPPTQSIPQLKLAPTLHKMLKESYFGPSEDDNDYAS